MRRKVDLVILLLVLIAGVFAVKNAQAIGDWAHGLRYEPPTEIARLATDAGMSKEGKALFYRFSPQLVDQQTLDQKCDAEKLGCAEGRSIYILDYTNEEEYNRAVVTAAHEMLHVVYSRLNDAQRQALETQLTNELQAHTPGGIDEKLKTYPAEDYYNEAHSFVGSELEEVSPALERHYARYFTDRAKVTTAYRDSPE